MKWFAAVLLLFNLLAYYWFDRESAVVDPLGVSSGVDDKVPSLVLLSELSEQETAAGSTDAIIHAEEGSSCWILGPMDESSIERLSAEMDAAGLSVTARSDVDTQIEGYWVYLPAAASEQARQQQTSALQADSIDFFVFASGQLENGVSLGFFNQRGNAEQKQRELLAAGYSPEIVSTESLGESFWVSMPGLTFDSLSKSFWQDMGKLSPAMAVEPSECGEAKR